jgi:hypothetical protein
MELLFWPFFAFLGLLGIAALIVWIWALIDCVQVPDDSMYQSGNKLIWVLIIVFTNWIGALLYFLIGRPKGGGEAATPPEPSSPPTGGAEMPPPPGSS